MVTNSGGGGGGSQDRSTGSKVLDGGSCGSDGEIKRTTMLKKGPWTAAEDAILKEYVEKYGEGNWNAVQRNSGLARCGKSCRLRWANHLRPNLKKGAFSPEEERLILELHAKLGNKWARMAAQLPGRTDNEIKNYWNTRVKRRLRQGLPLYPQEIQFRTSPYHHQNNITQTQNLLPTSPSSNSPTHHSLPPHNSSLSIFDSNSPNSATHFFTPLSPPPISLPFNQFKRYHNPNVEFSFNPISSNPHPSSPLGQYMPSPLGQSMFTQIPHISSFSFGYANFDQNSYQPYQTQFKSDDGLIPSTGGLAFSIKPELPSNQIFPTKMQCDTDNDMKKDMNVAARHESGLLDDLLRESQTMSSAGQSRRRGLLGSDQENCMFDGFPSHWDDSGSIASSSEMKTKEEPAEQNNFMHEDFSNSLNIMPPTMEVPLWFSTTEEISNGQSSGGVDSLGIDLQQSTSSLPITTSNWDNMPGFAE